VLSIFFGFLLGLFFAPVVRPLLRPMFVELVKLTMTSWYEGRRMSAKVREEVEDAIAQAEAEQAAKARTQAAAHADAAAAPPAPAAAAAAAPAASATNNPASPAPGSSVGS
jgi:predicted lipid-binding transport protein (Tim44 family)